MKQDTGFTASLPRKRASAGALILGPRGRVLMVDPIYKPYWDLPGGHVEEGESPRAAVEREVKEELGFAPIIGRLLVVDYLPTRGNVTEALMFVFHAKVPHGSRVQLDPQELRGWGWCDDAARNVRVAQAPILRQRVAAAVFAQQTGATFFLECGLGVPLS